MSSSACSVAKIKSFKLQAPEELTEDQKEAIREVFTLFDADGDETIGVNDLGTVMRVLGQNPTEQELNAIVAEIDADGNGVIEYPELEDLMSRRSWGWQGSDEEISDAFRTFDVNDDGYINVSELRHELTTSGEKLTDEQVDAMLLQFPPDGEGKVKFEDFVSLMMDH